MEEGWPLATEMQGLAPHRTWGSGAQSALYPVLRERHKPYLIYEATFLRFLISCLCTDKEHVLRSLSGGCR